MIYTPDDPKGRSKVRPRAVCVVFVEGVTPEQAEGVLRPFNKPDFLVAFQLVPTLGMANVVVPEGQEDWFIGQVTQNPLVHSAEREYSAILM